MSDDAAAVDALAGTYEDVANAHVQETCALDVRPALVKIVA